MYLLILSQYSVEIMLNLIQRLIFFEDYQVNDVKFITDKFKSILFTHEGKPKFSPVFLLDRIPHNLSSNDESAKYIRIIPFNQRFEHCSKDFNVKSIAQEFYSLVHSYVRIYKEEGLDEPLSFSTKYLLGGPSVICEQFIIENVSINSLSSVSKQDLYSSFKYWYKTNYDGPLLPMNKFVTELLKDAHSIVNGRFIGIQLKSID